MVAVRCSFLIRPDGRTEVHSQQEAPVFAPEFHGDPATSSLKYDSDFYLQASATDILLHGHAHAPDGQAVTRVDVGMRIGTLTKILRVTGERVYRDDAVRLSPEPTKALCQAADYLRAGPWRLESETWEAPRPAAFR